MVCMFYSGMKATAGTLCAQGGGLEHSNLHFEPEHGCVVPTSRCTSSQHPAVLSIHALRLVLRTQPRAPKENGCMEHQHRRRGFRVLSRVTPWSLGGGCLHPLSPIADQEPASQGADREQ